MSVGRNKKIVIYGGGTHYFISNHFSLCAPAYGETAIQIAELCHTIIPNMEVDLRLTRMAGGNKHLNTYQDLVHDLEGVVADQTTKVIIMNAAVVDFMPFCLSNSQGDIRDFGKYKPRLHSDQEYTLEICPTPKILRSIRKTRKDIFLVGFKSSTDYSPDQQYIAAMDLLKKNSCNLVLANDTITHNNMVVTPEESRYHVTINREEALRGLLTMVNHRTHLTFTRSTVKDGTPVKWASAEIPDSLRKVVEHCIANNAYKPFNGVTTGHFAFKVNDNTFITSIRRTNFNDIATNGMVRIVTDGPDTILAYGAKPSVGGQSQRIIFKDHPGLDCIVHFHCPKKNTSQVPTVSQYEFECGSHECGQNTSNGLKRFGDIYAVYLDNHGPNIVFNRDINPQIVIDFINENFDLSQKTGGYLTIIKDGKPLSTIETAVNTMSDYFM